MKFQFLSAKAFLQKKIKLKILLALSCLVLAGYASWHFVCARYFSIDDRVYSAILTIPDRTWAIVLGAKVWGDIPSPMLEDRLETSLDLLKTGKVKKLLLSGGPSEVGLHEAEFMQNWFRERGIAPDALVMDRFGLRTLDSMNNAREQFGVVSPIIVTQKFHLPRAIFLAKHVGMDAIGMIADRRVYKSIVMNQFREGLARFLAVYDISSGLTNEVGLLRDLLFQRRDKSTEIESGRQRISRKFVESDTVYPPRHVQLVYLKSTRNLQVYVSEDGIAWQVVIVYPVLAASGSVGPKLREGDRQVPEGIYRITYLNYRSRFHLALRLDYPNSFDKKMALADGRENLGGDIMIHGNQVSIGCIAIGNPAIEELFALAEDTDIHTWKVLIAPRDLRLNQDLDKNPLDFPTWYDELLTMLKEHFNSLPVK